MRQHAEGPLFHECMRVFVWTFLVFIPPPLGPAPPQLSAVPGRGCFYGSLAESSSRCLKK